MPDRIDPTTFETPEEFHARVMAATDSEGRLPVAVEEMPGWDVFPFEIDSLRLKPLQPLADAEPPRRGEDPDECWCATAHAADDEAQFGARVVWSSERWRLIRLDDMRIPVAVVLEPLPHCDLTTVPHDLAEEMGRLLVAVSAAVEAVPSVGRVQLAKYGDGGAHLHLFLFGRPARMLQLRGSPMLDWEENLPALPASVRERNAAYVAQEVAGRVGGTIGA